MHPIAGAKAHEQQTRTHGTRRPDPPPRRGRAARRRPGVVGMFLLRRIGAVALLAFLIGTSAAQAQSQPLIVNGKQTKITSVPWQVFVYNEKLDRMCGGSILNSTTVLTAAHCVTTGTSVRAASEFTVIAGLDDLR